MSFVFLVYILSPFISPTYRNYGHYSLGYGSIGRNPQEVFVNLLTRPQQLLSAMFTPPIKFTYLFQQLASYAFLSLAGFQVWLLLFFEFFTRLANGVMIAKWPLHSFTVSAISGVALIYAAGNLQKKISPRFLGIILLLAALAGDFFFHGPVNSLFKPQFYQQSSWSRADHQILDKIPANVSVAANNSLVPHLSQREEIYLLPDVHQAQYVVADLHDWPNAFTPIDRKEITTLIENLIDSEKYKLIAKIDDTILLQRR